MCYNSFINSVNEFENNKQQKDKQMTNNTLNTQATELLETTTIIRDNKKVQLLHKRML